MKIGSKSRREALSEMIILTKLPFKFVEHEDFINFCKVIGPQIHCHQGRLLQEILCSLMLKQVELFPLDMGGSTLFSVCAFTDSSTLSLV